MRPPRPSTAPADDTPTIVTSSVFKAKVTSYLRFVERTGSTVVVTNRGRPVATLTSAVRRPGNTFVGAGRGAIRVPHGAPTLTALAPWGATSLTVVAAVEQTQSSPAPRLLSGGQPAPLSDAEATSSPTDVHTDPTC